MTLLLLCRETTQAEAHDGRWGGAAYKKKPPRLSFGLANMNVHPKCPNCGRDGDSISFLEQLESKWPNSTSQAYKCACGLEFTYIVFEPVKKPPEDDS